MARIGIIFGLLLCGLTYAALVVTNTKSPIQFIPMMVGIPTLFCGVVALNPHRRRHAMRASAVLALLGTSIGMIRSLTWFSRWLRDDDINRYAAALNGALLIVSGTFLIICCWSLAIDRQRVKRSSSIPMPKSTQNESNRKREIA